MEGVVIVNASKNSHRISVAATTAKSIESNHSLMADFFFGWDTLFAVNSLLKAMLFIN
jgi:hypothetical protein